MRTRTLPRVVATLALVAALALSAAACGSDDEKTSSSGGQATTDTTTTTAADGTSTVEPGTVVDVAVPNPDFTTLVAAVRAASLVGTLKGDGPFTVFAPVNSAFEALPAGTVETLLKPENKELLTAVLTYHVVAGKLAAADLTDGKVLETVQGEKLTVAVSGEDITIKDATGNTATVVAADVAASNGVIHVIDGVLLPKAAA